MIESVRESVRQETANGFATLRQEVEADINQIHDYIAGELSELLTTTFNTIATEFEHTRLDVKALQNKFVEVDVSNLQAENAALRADLSALQSIVGNLAAEVSRLSADVADNIDRSGGKIVTLRGNSA